jgi:hypothetical protein
MQQEMKTTKDQLSEMVGYTVGSELRRMILNEVRESGADIRQVASKYHLAPLVTLNADGTFKHNGKVYKNAKEFEKDSPLGPFAKIVIVGTNAKMEKYKLNKE